MTAPTLHRLPVPAHQPPFDDERPPRLRIPASQGALALRFELPSSVAMEPESPRLAPVPVPVAAEDDWAAPRRTGTVQLPDARAWAGRLAQALLEVVTGDRPAAQLLRWTTIEVHEVLATAAASARRAAPRGPRGLAVIRSLRVSSPADGVAEACAVARHGSRARALAFRLEGQDGRWRCTALQWG